MLLGPGSALPFSNTPLFSLCRKVRMALKEMVSDGSWAGLFVCKKSKNQTKLIFQPSLVAAMPNIHL